MNRIYRIGQRFNRGLQHLLNGIILRNGRNVLLYLDWPVVGRGADTAEQLDRQA